jgi:hypothetical protein
VVVSVATGNPPAGGLNYVEYPATATISGRVTTPVWVRHQVTGAAGLTSVTCVAGSGCVAADETGDVLTTSDPTGGSSAWHQDNVDGTTAIAQVTCQSAALCVAVDNAGNVVASTDAWDTTPVWTVANIDGTNKLTGVACPGAGLCVAVDSVGDALSSTDPTGGASAWTATSEITPLYGGVYPEALTAVSCPSTTACFALDGDGYVVSSSDPAGGTSAWTANLVFDALGGTSISCPSTSLCLVDGGNGSFISTNPTGGASDWHVVDMIGSGTVLCPSTTLCLATAPEAGGGGWDKIEALSVSATGQTQLLTTHNNGPYPPHVTALACLSPQQCVAVDNLGYVLQSTNPTGLWRVQLSEQAFPFKQKPKVAATMTTTEQPDSNGIGDYSFAVNPVVATRYVVTKLGPGGVSHSKISTIYVIPSSRFGGESNCTTRPTCRMTASFTYRMPRQVQARETAKPWHLYLRVSHGSYQVRGVWHRDASARIAESKVTSDRYRVKLAFTIDDGNGIGAFEFAFCRKQTEARDGFAFPGTDPCGAATLPSRYFA